MKTILRKSLGSYLNTLSLVSPQLAGREGFRLFCSPGAVDLKSHHKQFLDTAEQFPFYSGNTYLQAYRWGHGPRKVLFLHGWQSHSFRWKHYIAAFDPEEYTFYAFDAPGHGLSGGKLLHAPLYKEIIRQFILAQGRMEVVVGHSLGGFSILYALYEDPTLPVGKLVIMAAPGEGNDFMGFYSGMLGLSERTQALILQQCESLFGHPMRFFSTERFAIGLKIPGLIVHDREDPEASYQYACSLHDAWKSSSLLTTRGLKHNLKSAEVVQGVFEYISGNGVSLRETTECAFTIS